MKTIMDIYLDYVKNGLSYLAQYIAIIDGEEIEKNFQSFCQISGREYWCEVGCVKGILFYHLVCATYSYFVAANK